MEKNEPGRTKVVHVAVGVIRRELSGFKQIFLSKRLDHAHQGGLWEFPGGKVESDEIVTHALCRELQEELGIDIDSSDESALQPLIKIRHDYSDKSVLLDVWTVNEFIGEPSGQEGQEVKWVNEADLTKYQFPAANVPIISACQLPSSYVITPEYTSLDSARKEVAVLLEKSPEMLLLRLPSLSPGEYVYWVKALLDAFPFLMKRIMLGGQVLSIDSSSDEDASVMEYIWSKVKGVHLPFKVAEKFESRPVRPGLSLAISCHNEAELAHAQVLEADFVTLSPVNETTSHPGVPSMGWKRFSELVLPVAVPVYALGGMQQNDLATACEYGAQGIAGISLWQL